jgi:hypothetical protein
VIYLAAQTTTLSGTTIDAWFDGITLDAIPSNDVIFKNGFD